MNEGRPALKQFLRAYLHEDWDIVYGNVWGALDSYLRSAEDGGRSLAAEIRRLLEDSDDAGLKEVLRSHHCAYSTRRYPGGDREWLREVARRAEAMMVTSSTCTIPTPHRNEVRPMHGDLLQDLDHLSPELWSFLGG